MNKLVILTTSIIRGDFQKKSIGTFYELFGENLKLNYKIHHLINIDAPDILLKHFNVLETIKLYQKIIPMYVDVHFIQTTKPSFLGAHKNLIKKINELSLDKPNNLFWWLEDDWQPIVSNLSGLVNSTLQKIPSLSHLFATFLQFNNSHMILTNNSPLGSFRGGPIMTYEYFKNYFNLLNLGVQNDTCDPEKQYGRWLSGINRQNGKQMIHRIINNTNNTIDIIYISSSETQFNPDMIPTWIYNKFNPAIKFNYHFIHMSQNNNIFNCSKIINGKIILTNQLNENQLKILFDNSNIKYFILIPHILEDIGRKFNEIYLLKKWTTINDMTTYA